MREFLATLLALVIILGTMWAIFAFLSLSGSFSESLGISQVWIYFFAGITIGVYRRKICQSLRAYCDGVWTTISRVL